MNNGNVSVRLLGKTYKGFQHIGPLRKGERLITFLFRQVYISNRRLQIDSNFA